MVELSHVPLNDVFRALADPTRRAMLRRLSQSEASVGELAEPFMKPPAAMSLAAASKHIKVLEHAGLVDRTIQGRIHTCRLNPKPLSDATEWLRYYERFWSERLDDLERALRADADPKPKRKRRKTS
ncbi:MAG: ArsR family transcriptional regulator [Alphaproteobacteria bacterium]|nr:ArsR family transcriptional regulator [Alphaproteobacteria bacterium]